MHWRYFEVFLYIGLSLIFVRGQRSIFWWCFIDLDGLVLLFLLARDFSSIGSSFLFVGAPGRNWSPLHFPRLCSLAAVCWWVCRFVVASWFVGASGFDGVWSGGVCSARSSFLLVGAPGWNWSPLHFPGLCSLAVVCRWVYRFVVARGSLLLAGSVAFGGFVRILLLFGMSVLPF